MKKIGLAISILLVSLSNVLANTAYTASNEYTQTIRGTVTDGVTGFPLIGANVILLNSDPLVGTITDVNGDFELPDIPLGRQNLDISYVGYHHKIIPNILLTSGKEVVFKSAWRKKPLKWMRSL